MNKSIVTSEVIHDGDFQIINLPEGFQFDAEVVFVKKIGNAVFLCPVNKESTSIKIELRGDEL